jgi:hypothetical protein
MREQKRKKEKKKSELDWIEWGCFDGRMNEGAQLQNFFFLSLFLSLVYICD